MGAARVCGSARLRNQGRGSCTYRSPGTKNPGTCPGPSFVKRLCPSPMCDLPSCAEYWSHNLQLSWHPLERTIPPRTDKPAKTQPHTPGGRGARHGGEQLPLAVSPSCSFRGLSEHPDVEHPVQPRHVAAPDRGRWRVVFRLPGSELRRCRG